MESYELIRSRRRTLALEITRDCRVLVRSPLGLSQAKIDAFVESHVDWIQAHLEQQRQRMASTPPPPTQADIATLKAKARAVLPEKVAYWSEKMGVRPTGLKITTARKRYGSCSGKNSLCFSLYLMEYPPDAIEAVVVHELAHIRRHDHSAAFYAEVAKVMPDYKERRKLLKM